jgi:hypothetical protein
VLVSQGHLGVCLSDFLVFRMRLRVPHRKALDSMVHPAILMLVLLLSAIAGRQLFMDGATDVVQTLQNPIWFPSDQETPRRFFSLLWTTAPVRLIGFLAPGSIELATVAFGVACYLQIAIPLIFVLRSRLLLQVKSLLVVLFVGGTIFLANFAATELLFALGLTTIFVIWSLDDGQDPKCTKRLVAAVLLIASYEVVALSNLILALGILLSQEPMTGRRRLLIAVLVLALPFQLLCFLSEPIMPAQNVFNFFVFEIAGIGTFGLIVGVLVAKSLLRWRAAQEVLVLICLAIPLLILLAPDHFIYLRTREFQYAHPSRIFSAGITVLIALLPILLDRRVWAWPSRLLDWIGARSLTNLAVASLAAFYSVSVLASTEAFTYRTRLKAELSQLSGMVSIEDCEFCNDPEKFGYANLGHPTLWPAYSMAYSLENARSPRVIVIATDRPGEINGDQIADFLKRGLPRQSAVEPSSPSCLCE